MHQGKWNTLLLSEVYKGNYSGRAVDKDVQHGLTPLLGLKRRDPFQIEGS
jgi:hypothetical protein